MKKEMKNKKANVLIENVVFIIIVLIFFTMVFLFLNTKSNNISMIEEINAKKIALLIDSAGKDTKIIVDVEEVYNKNKLTSKPIVIDPANNLVIVKMSDKTGYSYGFFNKVNVDVEDNEQNGRRYLILTIN